MSITMSTGQITIVDLTDSRPSSFYLQANQSKIQVYNVDTKTYSPDYTASPNLVITPKFFFGNDDYTEQLDAVNLTYKINGHAVADIANATQNGNKLTISQNIGAASVAPFNGTTLNIIATIENKEGHKVWDEETGVELTTLLEASIEIAKVDTGKKGDDGDGIRETIQQYILSKDSEKAPAQENEDWKAENPTWVKDSYLWIRTKIIYTKGKVEYTTPYCDSSWKAASDGVAGLNKDIEEIHATMKTMQGQIDGAIETWYLDGDPTAEGFVNPWARDLEGGDTDALKEKHVGDLYFDTETGKSYRYFGNSTDGFAWTPITDTELSEALTDIRNLQTEVDSKVTIFYGDQAFSGQNPPTPNQDDMWVKDDGSFWQYKDTSWTLSSYSIDSVEFQYAKNQSATSAPEGTDFSSESPTWEEGYYIWQRTKTSYKGGVKDPDYSTPICISAAAARTVKITGEQVFKSLDGTTYAPETITLAAVTTGGLDEKVAWKYKQGEVWKPLDVIKENYIISPTSTTGYWQGTVATFKAVGTVYDEDSEQYQEIESCSDVISIYKVTDGQKGADGTSPIQVFLTNENITFSADADGKVSTTELTFSVVGYEGATKTLPTVGRLSSYYDDGKRPGWPSGLVCSSAGPLNSEAFFKLRISSTTNLGAEGPTCGRIVFPITKVGTVDTKDLELTLTWSKVNAGKKGDTGDAGAPAVFAIVESSNGKVVFTDSDSGDIVLKSSLYVGGSAEEVEENNPNYVWTSFPEHAENGGVLGVGPSLTVTRDMVPSAKSFICTITYDSETYYDSIALSDKTDPIYCKLESSQGDKFTNGNIQTVLTCRVFDGTGEIDKQGTKYTYTWQKLSNGKAVAFTTEEGKSYYNMTEVTGKTITIGSEHVSSKAVFACTVTKAAQS